jgi:hypothetical protein
MALEDMPSGYSVRFCRKKMSAYVYTWQAYMQVNILKMSSQINNAKFLGTETKTVTGVIVLQFVLFTLLHDTLKLLPISGHDMNKRIIRNRLSLNKKQRGV